MDDRFDKYLRDELQALDNVTVPAWDKELAWMSISNSLQPNPKAVRMSWLYVAASLLFLLMVSWGITYHNFSDREAMLKMENDSLKRVVLLARVDALRAVNEQNKSMAQNRAVQQKIIREVVQKTVYVHDTVRVIAFEKVAVIRRDSTENVVKQNDFVTEKSNKEEKKSKLQFVMSNNTSGESLEVRSMFVSSVSLLPQNDSEAKKSDLAIKIMKN